MAALKTQLFERLLVLILVAIVNEWKRKCKKKSGTIFKVMLHWVFWFMVFLCYTGSLQEGSGLDPFGSLDPPSGQPAKRQHRRLGPGCAAALLLPSAAIIGW